MLIGRPHARRGRARIWALVRLTLAGCVLMLNGCSSVHLGTATPCKPEPEIEVGCTWGDPEAQSDISLVSWNLHGPPNTSDMAERLMKVADKVLSLEPDVALFQEVWFERDAERHQPAPAEP